MPGLPGRIRLVSHSWYNQDAETGCRVPWGRSSTAEQGPFKPKVQGSNPTAPTELKRRNAPGTHFGAQPGAFS